MKTIVITGGAGFLGTHAVQALFAGVCGGTDLNTARDDEAAAARPALPREFCVRVLDWLPYELSYYKGIDLPKSCFQYLQCDMTRKKDFRKAAEGAGAIIHLARSEDPSAASDLIDYNCSMAENISSYATDHDLESIVLASSFQVYGSNAAESISEDAPCSPVTPYAQSKYLCEGIFKEVSARTGIRTDILRFFNIYGPGAGTGILKLLKELTAKGVLDIDLHNDGLDGRDYIYIDDAVNAMQRALFRGSCLERGASASNGRCDVFNVGTGRCTTVVELVELAIAVSGCTIRPHFGPGRDPIRTISANCGKMYGALGLDPVVKLEDGLARFWNR